LSGGFTLNEPQIGRDAGRLLSTGIRTIVTSEEARSAYPDFYRSLGPEWEAAARFPAKRRGGPAREIAVLTYLPIDASLWDYSRPGPEMIVLRKR
jgi:hypothetical protein